MEVWNVGDYCEACVKVIREIPGALCEIATLLPDGKMCLGFCVSDMKPTGFPDMPSPLRFSFHRKLQGLKP